MNETTITAWLARDNNGSLWLYLENKPYKCRDADAWWNFEGRFKELDRNLFPSIRLDEDEPRKVEITIKLK